MADVAVKGSSCRSNGYPARWCIGAAHSFRSPAVPDRFGAPGGRPAALRGERPFRADNPMALYGGTLLNYCVAFSLRKVVESC